MSAHQEAPTPSAVAVERLTALWALNEAGLGGVLHAFRLPFTGILVGGTAIVLITLIASFAENRARAILRALVIVLVVKASASPHSPVMAYAAVGFQGLLGALLFGATRGPRVSALLLGTLGVLESAVQKLAVMTVLYGTALWEAIDLFAAGVLKEVGAAKGGGTVHASLELAGAYVGLHLVAGVLIGWMAGGVPGEVSRLIRTGEVPPPVAPAAGTDEGAPQRRSRRSAWTRALLVVLLLAGTVASITLFTPGGGGASRGAYIVVRTLLILAVWYVGVAPLALRALRWFARRRGARYGEEVARALALLPHLRRLARAAWRATAQEAGYRRWRRFLVILIVWTLMAETVENGAP